MRRIAAVFLAFALLAPVLSVQAQTAAAERKFSLKLAGIKTPADPASKAMERFAETVAKNSSGSVTVKTFNNSVLGSINDMLSGMPNGITDLF